MPSIVVKQLPSIDFDIEFKAPLPSPPVAKHPYSSKEEPRHITIDIDDLPRSQFDGDSVKSITFEEPPLKPRLLERISLSLLEWGTILLLVTYFVSSIFLYIVLPRFAFQVLWYIYMVTNFYIAANTVIESCLSITPNTQARKAIEKVAQKGWIFPTPDEDVPLIDIVIVAYLPNEKDIIMDRALYALEKLVYPRFRLQVNIVYNTPTPMPDLQSQLHKLAQVTPNLRVFQVPNSKSKADNVNHFLSLDVQTDIIAIFDCDHYPHPYGPRWAAERFAQDKTVDVVQGRCVVFNAANSFLTSLIAVEFDKIYASSHPGRAEMWDFGLFCGSNGYWKASLLRGIRMDDSMLTEDIDSALRALSKNAKVIHELNATSYELAPTTYTALLKQRLRWAQGWTQASIRHAVLVWNKPEERNRKSIVRCGLASLLFVRELSYYLVTQYACLLVNIIVIGFPKNSSGLADLIFFQFPLSTWFFIISLITLIITLAITNFVRSEFVTRWMMVKFALIYPVYLVVNATLGVYGHARQLVGYSNWNPTART